MSPPAEGTLTAPPEPTAEDPGTDEEHRWWETRGDEPRLADGPFKYLDYYEEEDRVLLEGRAAAAQAVVTGIMQSRTFVLYGASGSGKTSLLLAGVFPELSDRGYQPIYARMLDHPTSDLVDAVAEKLTGNVPPEADAREILRRCTAEKPVVLALDQFEELFVRFEGQPELRMDLARLIGSLLRDPEVDLRVIFVLRQEWLGELDDFRDELPDLFDHEHRLRSLTAFGARQAIARHLEHGGVEFEPQLLLDLVDHLEEFQFDPTILQIIGSEVYRRARERDPEAPYPTSEDLRTLGSVQAMFEDFLDRFDDRIPEDLRVAASAVLDALTTRKRTKQALRPSDIAGKVVAASEEDVHRILRLLAKWGLVREDRRGTDVWYELVHERLVAVVNDWLERDTEFFQFRLARELATSSIRTEASVAGALLSRVQLERAVAPHADTLVLDREQVEFLFRSSLFSRSEAALATWGGRLSDARRRELVEEAMEAGEPGVRAGAVWSLRHLEYPALRTRLGTIVLQDPHEDVRAEAASTLAQTGDAEEIHSVVEAASTGEGAPRALDGLVGMYRGGRRLRGVGLRRSLQIRWRAWREGRKELHGRRGEVLALGLRTGAWWGAIWSAFLGVPILVASWWASGETVPGEGAFFVWLGAGVATALASGAVLGAGFAYGGAVRLAIRPTTSWLRVTLLAGNVWVLALLVVTGGAAWWFDFEGDPLYLLMYAVGVVIWFPVFLLLKALVGLLLQILRRAQLEHGSANQKDPTLPVGLGYPVVIPFALASVFMLLGWTNWVVAGWPVAAAVLSFLTVVLGRVAEAVDRWRGDDPRIRTRAAAEPARGSQAAVLASLLPFVLFPVTVGLDTIPLFQSTHSADEPVSGTLSRFRPDADFFRVDLGDGELAVVSPEREPWRSTWLRIDGPIVEGESVVRAGGTRWVSVETDDQIAEGGPIDYVFSLNPIPVLAIPVDAASLEEDMVRFVEVRMAAVDSAGCFTGAADTLVYRRGTVSGTIPRPEARTLASLAEHIELIPLRSNLLPDMGSLRASLCVSDLSVDAREGAVAQAAVAATGPGRPVVVGDTAQMVFASGPQPVEWLGNEYPITVDEETGRWRARVELRFRRSSGERGKGGVPDEFPVLFGLRLVRGEHFDPSALLTEARLRSADDDSLAASLYLQAAEATREQDSHALATDICLWGALDGYAEAVVPACNRAVELAPGLTAARDARSLAMAITGDSVEAERDFRVAERGLPEELVTQRRAWMARLAEGVPPELIFTPAVRDSLRAWYLNRDPSGE